ncbi:MAG TPA: hypothetical protein VJ969_03415 [Desulfopila sp.]|nr:hypothetical protein [Desulfopila sp.]
MIIRVDEHTTIDTEKDLDSAERHVLQKLLCYKIYVGSVSEFREKTAKALDVGWNDQGPVPASVALKQLIQHIEKEIDDRIKKG